MEWSSHSVPENVAHFSNTLHPFPSVASGPDEADGWMGHAASLPAQIAAHRCLVYFDNEAQE